MKLSSRSASSCLLLAGLLGLAASARAQTAAPDNGLLGQNYAGVDEGYLRSEQHPRPIQYHDYGFTDNQAIARGLDFNLNYDYLTGTDQGVHDFRDTLLAGFTGYAPVKAWARPFLQAEAGWSWQRMSFRVPGGADDNRLTTLLGAGVEFRVAPRLALSPYADYTEIHRFETDWNYGLKATYRLSPRWSLSLTPQFDEHHNLACFAGVNLHY